MTNLKILTTPNPILRAKAKHISKLDKKVLSLICDMKNALEKSAVSGAGLSATQINVPLQIFVAYMSKDSVSPQNSSISTKPSVFINPQVTWFSKELNTDVVLKENLLLEGCLSVPKIYALIKRPWAIKVKYQTIESLRLKVSAKGRPASGWQSSKFEGFNSTLFQHEIDHLNGILFTDRALAQGAQIYEVREDEKLHPVIL